jgi:ligand-binding sensor domain-containing protein
MKLQNSFLLFFIFIFSFSLFGQYLTSKNYTTADGLNNAVRSLFLDDKNVLWIGTENGVSTMQNGEFSILMSQTVWDITVVGIFLKI